MTRSQKIALGVAVALLLAAAIGLANVSQISTWMESSSLLSSIAEPAGNAQSNNSGDTSNSPIGVADPSAPVSSDGSAGEVPPSGSTGSGSNSSSSGSSAPNQGKTSTPPTTKTPGGTTTAPREPVVPPVPEPAPQESALKPAKISVHIRVDASAAVGKGFSGSSTMLSKNVSVAPGTSALDASKASGLSIKTRGTAFGTYVAAIGSLAEKDYGSASGWTYSINGSTPSKSSSKYIVEDGDSVTWIYVIN